MEKEKSSKPIYRKGIPAVMGIPKPDVTGISLPTKEELKEIEKKTEDMRRKNYETHYKPIIDALREHKKLTIEGISRVTRRPLDEESKYVDRLYEAGMLGKVCALYCLSENIEEDLKSTFGVV